MKCIKASVLSFVLYLISIPVFACGNEYYEMRKTIPYTKGKLDLRDLLRSGEGDDYMPYWVHGFIWKDEGDNGRYAFGEKIKKLGVPIEDASELSWNEIQAALNKKIDYKLLSDYAWNELKVGNKENAVKLLEALYKDHSNEYNVVANLGTAYEVTGKNKEALELLKKAVAINPQSHYGSEWIHIKILEQKISKNPDYRLILDLKADNDHAAWLEGKIYDKEITPDSLMVQLAYQLHERIGFVPAPDPIVAQLVKDFADLVAISRSGAAAIDFYDYAVKYDSSLAITAEERKKISPLVRDEEKTTATTKEKSKLPYIIGGVVILSIAGLYFASRKKISG